MTISIVLLAAAWLVCVWALCRAADAGDDIARRLMEDRGKETRRDL